jgi:hypothetical protein
VTNKPKQQQTMPSALRVGCAVAAGVFLAIGIKRVQRPGLLTSLLLGTSAYLTWDALTGVDLFSVIQKIGECGESSDKLTN